MKATLYGVWWVRVLLAAIATHLLNIVLIVALTVFTAFLASAVPGDFQGEIPVDRLAEQAATWGVPFLTVLAAAWAARDAAHQAAAVLHGSLVGLLVAIIFGMVFFWPFDLATLVLFVFIVLAGFLGGLIGARFPTRGKMKP
jgi:LytS/YehU family sensor histidine kinase